MYTNKLINLITCAIAISFVFHLIAIMIRLIIYLISEIFAD